MPCTFPCNQLPFTIHAVFGAPFQASFWDFHPTSLGSKETPIHEDDVSQSRLRNWQAATLSNCILSRKTSMINMFDAKDPADKEEIGNPGTT